MKKKKLITVIIGLILVFVSWQAYMCDRYEGNLIINVSNQSERDTISLDLYIDGEKQASGLFTNEVFHNYKEYVFKTKKGSCIIIATKEDPHIINGSNPLKNNGDDLFPDFNKDYIVSFKNDDKDSSLSCIDVHMSEMELTSIIYNE